MKKNKILLTGGNGFFGRHVSKALKDADIKYTLSTKKDINILNGNEVMSKTKSFDTIIHLAGNVRAPASDSAEKHFNINSLGTLNILEACRVNKISRIILASTTDVYGNSLESGKINEFALTAPKDFYGQSKLLAEYFCQKYSEKFGINFTILRFAYLYGRGMYPLRLVSKILDSVARNKKLNLEIDPKAFMDMLYVKDAARAVVLALSDKRSLNKIVNISGAKKTTVKDLIKTAKYFYPDSKISVSTKKETQNYYIYDNRLARKILNFKPEYNLKAGFKNYILCSEK